MEFTHEELSLMLYALEGGATGAAAKPDEPSCEEACPVVDHLEDIFGTHTLPPEKELARHLNNHLREALIESGMLELMAEMQPDEARALTDAEQARLQQANARLQQWSCAVKLDEPDKKMLSAAVARLPRAAWFTMPRTLWRLRKKLKSS
jgi:hypothetical protein